MTCYVVRHVKAGDRKKWTDRPDSERPISSNGSRQAAALAERFADAGVDRLVSSPYLRCVQSLEPLAEQLGLTVEVDDRLVEGGSFEQTLRLLGELVAAGSTPVVCSHGDVIVELISALVRRGTELRNEPDWRKATVWTLESGDGVQPDADGIAAFSSATVEPPPGKPSMNLRTNPSS